MIILLYLVAWCCTHTKFRALLDGGGAIYAGSSLKLLHSLFDANQAAGGMWYLVQGLIDVLLKEVELSSCKKRAQ
jgi:hypothetical protein